MYVSASIESLFVQIRHKHQEKLNRQSKFDEFGNPIQQDGSSKNRNEKTFALGSPINRSDSSKRSIPRPTRIKSAESHSVWPWVLAGSAVAAGVGTYLILSQSDKSSNNTLPVGTKP